MAALENLSKRRDIICKAADKGGALQGCLAGRPLPKRSFATTTTTMTLRRYRNVIIKSKMYKK